MNASLSISTRPLASWAAVLVVLLLGAYGVSALFIRPSLMPDPAYGLLVHKSMQAGAPWNHMTEADPENIAVDRSYFFSTWSPGQYAVPAVLINAGASIGSAVAIVSIVTSVVGLWGWWLLFRTIGVDATAAAVTCALIAASRSFNYSFVAYVGSDVLAFGVFPFLAAALIALRRSKWFAAAAFAAILIAFFAKNSLPIYLGAWIAGLVFVSMRSARPAAATMAPAILALVSVAAAFAVLQWGYLSRGWTPLTYQPVVSTAPAVYLLPWSMPAMAATSWDDIFSWVFSHPSGSWLAFDYKHSVLFVGAAAILSVLAAIVIVRRNNRESTWVVAGFSILVAAAFTALLSTGSAASLDLSRHYRIVGYVWLPFLVGWMLTSRRVVATVLALALAIPCAYGMLSFAANWRRHYALRDAHSDRVQVTHLALTSRLVKFLTALDGELPGGSTLVVTPAPMYALEFTRTRALATSAVADSAERLEAVPRRGTVDNLIVIAERTGMSETAQRAWLDSFAAYEHWDAIDLDNHRLYVPSGQPIGTAWLQARFDRIAR